MLNMKNYIIIIVLYFYLYGLFNPYRLNFSLMGYRGNLIPFLPFIFIDKNRSNIDKILNHEICHLNQIITTGALNFATKYIYEFINIGYNNMSLEINCRHEESKFCQKNYTTCY